MLILWFLREDWDEFQNGMYVGKKALKNHFLQNLHQLGHNVIKMVLEWKSKWVSTSLTSTIEVLCEEVELSSTPSAYLMHIPYTLSLISAENPRKK